MAIVTGTPTAQAEHNMPMAVLGFMLSMGIPAVLVVMGILALGWGAIHWLGAIVWGAVATMAFALFGAMGRAMGMTRLNVTDLLGSSMAAPHTAKAMALGLVLHVMNGILLAVGWAYGMGLLAWPANWATGMMWGAVLWLLALLMLSTMGAVHPAIRRGEQDDPGPAATNFGKMTPVGSLLGHLVYGLVLGLAYNAWPLT